MSLNKKIKAYTLSELIIVIIITSIIAGLSFSVLNLVHRHMNEITSNFEHEMLIKQTELRMRIDLSTHSKAMITQENQIVFKNYNDSVAYKFKEDYMLIDQDTIHLNIKDTSFYFKGKEVDIGNLDAIELVLKKTDKLEYRVFIYKTNDALNKLEDGY